jgi:hypothetical protein
MIHWQQTCSISPFIVPSDRLYGFRSASSRKKPRRRLSILRSSNQRSSGRVWGSKGPVSTADMVLALIRERPTEMLLEKAADLTEDL